MTAEHATHPYNLGDLSPIDTDRTALAIVATDEQGNETRLTYGALDDLANAVARGLIRRGLNRGDRIALLAANSAEFLAVLLGAQRAGLAVVPVNYKFPRSLSDFVIEDSGAKLVFTDIDRRAQVDNTPDVITFGANGSESFSEFLDHGPFTVITPAADEAALFLYTSGSTGKPKGVVLSHHSHLWVVRTRLAGSSLRGERYLIAAPMYHMNALALCQLALAGQATLIILPQFKARSYIAAIEQYRPTWLTAVPPMIAMALQEKDLLTRADLTSVQVVRMGSAPVSEALYTAVRRALPQARVVNSYGTTEAGPVTFGAHPDGLVQPDMSIGYAHPDVQVRLINEAGQRSDQGVLHVKSPGIMLGYHNRPDIKTAITHDGYYVTGDVLRRDAQGFYYFIGRNDDMFVCGGENIYPSEVEKVIEALPGVEQACVVPIADEIKGHKPVAFVVLTANSVLNEAAIKAHCLAHAPANQHPRWVWFVNALPIASTNKVDRKRLIQQATHAAHPTDLVA